MTDTEGTLTFNQYTVSDFWTGSVDGDGYPVLSAQVTTIADVPYELEFGLAANAVDVEVEVSFGGQVIGTINHSGAVFSDQTEKFTGTGGTDTLQFRVLDNTGGSGSQNVDTSGVIPSYEKTMNFMGQDVTLDAFMPGQGLVYQVLGGKLVKFDPTTNSYADLEYQNTFRINSIGFSTQHDLIFGQARQSGVDANGLAVRDSDIIAFDARGKVYKVAESPYRTYIGDTDENGDLWLFPGGIRTAHKLDFDSLDAQNRLTTTFYDLPDPMRGTKGLADMAYNPTTKTFYGVGYGNGTQATLFELDISGLSVGEGIVLTETPIHGTIVDGVTKAGIPRSPYGATMVDGDGNVYAGANNGDHDLNGSTPNSGGFYKLVTGDDGNTYMELLAASPSVSNNDGAMDTRGFDPFLGIDTSSTVLLKEPVLSVAIAEDDVVALSAKGASVTIDLLANDTVSQGETLSVTEIDGQAAAAGLQITLSNGEVATYNGDGTLTLTPAAGLTNVAATLTYTIENDNGVQDTATVTVTTSPVDGTAGDDQMVRGYRDADGNMIQGSDGIHDVILGYGGNDKIFAESGDDLIYGGDGNDVLDGGTGVDTMTDGDGNDIYYIDNAGDVISEGGGTGYDKLHGGDGADSLYGDAGNGRLLGARGNDV